MRQPSRRTALDEIRMLRHFLKGLRPFYRSVPEMAKEPSEFARSALANREMSFLELLDGAVFGHFESPYRRLLDWAGISRADLADSVHRQGLEKTLTQLLEAGVCISLEEFKGRRPIRRSGLEIPVDFRSFDNPLVKGHLLASTGGSTSRPVRLVVDLDLVAHDAVFHKLFIDSFGITDHALTLWRPLPPGAAGTKRALAHSALGLPMVRWFCHSPKSLVADPKACLFSWILVSASRRFGKGSIPDPVHAPLSGVGRIVSWLDSVRETHRIHFDTNVASALRICGEAKRRKLRLEHVFFRVGGEPLTPVRSRVFEGVGSRVCCHFSMAEVGPVAMACSTASRPDEMHLRLDKISIVSKPSERLRGSSDLHLSTLLPFTPKVMINVATGDSGVLADDSCDCHFDRLGYTARIHSLQSFEKLTAEGMHFLGADVLSLLDQELPGRFGGAPTDYQLVCRENRAGLMDLDLRISPRLKGIDDQECLKVVYRFLASRAPENRLMTAHLREADSLRVVRKEPIATGMGKILPIRTE